MFCRVPYTEVDGKHRPYLEVVFSNPTSHQNSNKTLAMVDSGADHTVMPFSLGTSIGLPIPTETEILANANGVGGNISYIERQCQIRLANKTTNRVYVFNETVWWIYPDAATQAEQRRLAKNLTELTDLQNQCLPNTNLHHHFEAQKTQVIQEFLKISNRLETNVLLGRPFFDNFEFIQFIHKDRNREAACYFNYKVAQGKPAEILPLEENAVVAAVQTVVNQARG